MFPGSLLTGLRLDPYGYGTDENGELMFRIDEEIARNEAELEHAPDEIEKKEVTPSFGLEWVNGTGEEAQKEVDKDSRHRHWYW